MTLDQFFDELAKTKETHQWHLAEGVFIRGVHAGRMCCPITAVCERPVFFPSQAAQAARELGLSFADCDLIVSAADWRMLVPVRERLLSTVGLS